MFFLVRLLILYIVIGAGVLFVQLSNTSCKAPLVLDDGRASLAAPLDMTRLTSDRDYMWQVGTAVIFWLPRLISYSINGDMPIKRFIFATDCKTV